MLDTALQPYTDVADLYVIDPDGYIIRYPSPHLASKIYLFNVMFAESGIPSSSTLVSSVKLSGYPSSQR